MLQQSYQEPVRKEDLDLARKLQSESEKSQTENEKASKTKKESIKIPETSGELTPSTEKIPDVEIKAEAEGKSEEVSDKIETAQKIIQAQKSIAQTSVASDASAISQITEYDKKVEKLVETALQKGPEHAIKVAQYMDKGKPVSQKDNYTLDEIHDKLIEEELRKQLFQKGLLKEL